ncbi:MAG TPA: transcriptional regulator [Holophagaceae bacterium]|nr:transcriptional regulator [Holophagaceae bacterium]
MSGFNEIIHQPIRLRIVSALATLGPEERVDFTHLKTLLKLSDGNLGAHLLKLEEVGYLTQEKTFVQRKPRTYLQLTAAGRTAFRAHVAELKKILG